MHDFIAIQSLFAQGDDGVLDLHIGATALPLWPALTRQQVVFAAALLKRGIPITTATNAAHSRSTVSE
jgi:hypothetical protein